MKSEPRPCLKNIMTPFPYAVESDSTLAQAKALMREHNFHHLPVIENGELVGVVSSQDILWAEDPLSSFDGDKDLMVKHIYRSDPYTVDLNEDLVVVLNEMARRHVGAALVLRNGKLAGVFTTTDACREFAKLLQKLSPDNEPLLA